MNPSIKALHNLYERNLNKVLEELKSYNKGENLYKINGEITNSRADVTLHICGNLRHFMGAMISGSGYIRQRNDEFGLKNVKKSKMVYGIKQTKKLVLASLKEMREDKLEEIYSINVFGKEMTTQFFLIHLYGHLNYDLGQINYQHRLLDK